MKMTREHALSLLANAPGPSPWYVLARASGIESRWGPLTWTSEPRASVLRDSEGNARLILDFYVHVIKLAPRRLFLWHEPRRGVGGEVNILGKVEFRIVDVDALQPIADVHQSIELLGEHRVPLIAFPANRSDHLPVLEIHARAPEGSLAVGMPEELLGIEELLFFVHVEGTRLWSLRPRLRMLHVMPQDWFNQGNFDFGYEWPTRAARDVTSGAIVGEGIRIREFLLDETGRNIARWFDRTD